MSITNNFKKKRALTRELLTSLEIKNTYFNMLNQTIIIDKLKAAHSNSFLMHYNEIEKWLDKTNTEYNCKINYHNFLEHMNNLATECEVIYFGIALLNTGIDLKDTRFKFIRFFSIYNIYVDFRFKNKFDFSRKEVYNEIIEDSNKK